MVSQSSVLTAIKDFRYTKLCRWFRHVCTYFNIGVSIRRWHIAILATTSYHRLWFSVLTLFHVCSRVCSARILYLVRSVIRQLYRDGVRGVLDVKINSTAILVPAGTEHNIINTGLEKMKMYMIYAPAHHIDGRVHKTKQDAEVDMEDEKFWG